MATAVVPVATATTAAPGMSHATTDAEYLHKAMKGLGTDDKTLVEIITRRANHELRAISLEYAQHYSKTLESEIKSETSGNYRRLLTSLVLPRGVYYAKQIRNAISGLGTDDGCLIDILCFGHNIDIKNAANEYRTIFNRDLIADIRGDTSGHYRELLISLAEGTRDETVYNAVEQARRVEEDAKMLQQKGEGRMGTDDDFFVRFFTKNSWDYINAVSTKYTELYGHNLEVAIKKETSGDFQRALTALAIGRSAYFAGRVHRAVSGLGTKDKLLIRVFVINHKLWLQAIGVKYEELFKKNMEKAIMDDTSGWYQKTLVALLQ